MDECISFRDRGEFRKWLGENSLTSGGVWLLFGKADGVKTMKAGEALEEALCFGWIDGQMQALDEKSYRKYFAPRRRNSKWSAKNKALTEKLEAQGLMTEQGRAAIVLAKENGQWDAPPPTVFDPSLIDVVAEVIKGREPAYSNFMAMPPSVKKTYTLAYLDAKTDEGRERRLAWMLDRLDKKLRPM